MGIKSIIIGGVFVVGIAYALFAYVYPNSGGASTSTNTGGGVNTVSAISPNTTAQLLHKLVNDERTKAGLQPLTWNDNIATLATSHSQDMLTNNYYEHTSPSGQTLAMRAVAANVCARGENLNQVGSSYGDMSSEDAAHNTITSWLNSSEHRTNILNAGYTQEGIGIVLDSNGKTGYVTQDFC